MTQTGPISQQHGATVVQAGEFDAARRRMQAYAALIDNLASPGDLQQVGSQVVSRLHGDVEALAVYVEMPDGGLTLQSHAGFVAMPPTHAVSASAFCCPEVAELAELAGARRVLPLCNRRPSWVGPQARGFTVVPFDAQSPARPGGLVLFFLRAASHDPSLAALLDLATQAMTDALARDPASAHTQACPTGRTRVLLVDDAELLVMHVKRILERSGFAFHFAQRARDGFDLALAIQPDVILVDKVMPDLDGIELLRMMRATESLRTVPVIMLSGQADEKARVEALREGADDFVVKPFSAKELIARIEANVRLVRLRRDVVWRQGELLRLRQSQQELRNLLDTVQTVRNDERRMLAREVHDQLGQVLTAAKIDIRLLQDRLGKPGPMPPLQEIEDELASALSSVDMAIMSVQDISALLRPPALEEGGLLAALRWQAADIQRRAKITCEVWCDDARAYVEPAPFVAGELLRMCQEALTNVLRHAAATHVIVQVVVRAAHLVVRVCDNGIGIPPERLGHPASIGLKGMRERAASIRAHVHIHGRAGRGTMVVIRRRLAF